ncbi:30S ribosomal protein S16 [Candidatus Peregrinibacteria bacterium]|nr:30S ribosomal protein S16 [Candidatus Peregrinibacteria bacterium]
MLAIRLGRIGKNSQPSFRIILQEKTSSPKSKAFEVLGNYNPKTDAFNVSRERVEYWVLHGAKPSPTLAILLKKNGLPNMEKYIKMEQHQRKKKEAGEDGAKKEEAKTEKASPKKEAKTEAKTETPKTADAPKKEAKAETPKETAAAAAPIETPPAAPAEEKK